MENDEMEFSLNDIKGDEDPVFNVIKHRTLARVGLWLILQFKVVKMNEVYSVDLQKFLKCSIVYALRLLKRFSDVGLLTEKKIGNTIYFLPVRTGNDKHLKLLDYKKRMMKTLGLK